MTPKEKSFLEISSDDLAKACLKYTYGLIYHILEMLMLNPHTNQDYLAIITPFLYYLNEHKSVAEYLFSTYKQLKDKFEALFLKLRDDFMI